MILLLLGLYFCKFDKNQMLMSVNETSTELQEIPVEHKNEVLNDFRIASISRHCSLIGRKEVLTGKAKFGIFGDGKEVPQIVLSKFFENGDWRSGYYRDQTMMFAMDICTPEQWFAQLYAHANLELEPHSAGRQMGGHFATRTIDDQGNWKNHMESKNTSGDISPTAGQMSRALGLSLASKHYRNNEDLHHMSNFSNEGGEVTFVTIGDASTSEGPFWETMNAAAVLNVPMVVSVWDDGYGISVPKKYQTTKQSISEALAGFQYEEGKGGMDIYKVKAWDYAGLHKVYAKAVEKTRSTHIPCLIHVEEVTQPQGHSTSGSHERYKDADRLQFEKDFDGLVKMREWITSNGLATDEELDAIDKEAKDFSNQAKRNAWKAFSGEIKAEITEITSFFDRMKEGSSVANEIEEVKTDLLATLDPVRKDVMSALKEVLRLTRYEKTAAREELVNWKKNIDELNYDRYNSVLYSQSPSAAIKETGTAANFEGETESIPGYQILNRVFDYHLSNIPELVAFGEDVGQIGDVNQAFAGLQEKHGDIRVFDTGIRENTIIGQGIGMALRGIRPIAEIQYLDYLLYGLQPLSDDLATLQYRTKGGQKAPLIVRTRGHRLEGIWHTGSPMQMILGSLRGMYVCVPRNMVQAAGMYNTLLASDDPALVIECLNGYRIRENVPSNLNEFKIPLGKVETVRYGSDITVVSYGSTLRVVEQAAEKLAKMDVDVEVIDIQTLIPFDLSHDIVESLKNTGKILFVDEDVSGGATAYMYQKVIEEQGGYYYQDMPAQTLTAKDHRGAYGSDGDYFSKPSVDDIIEKIYEMMSDDDPASFPELY